MILACPAINGSRCSGHDQILPSPGWFLGLCVALLCNADTSSSFGMALHSPYLPRLHRVSPPQSAPYQPVLLTPALSSSRCAWAHTFNLCPLLISGRQRHENGYRDLSHVAQRRCCTLATKCVRQLINNCLFSWCRLNKGHILKHSERKVI